MLCFAGGAFGNVTRFFELRSAIFKCNRNTRWHARDSVSWNVVTLLNDLLNAVNLGKCYVCGESFGNVIRFLNF